MKKKKKKHTSPVMGGEERVLELIDQTMTDVNANILNLQFQIKNEMKKNMSPDVLAELASEYIRSVSQVNLLAYLKRQFQEEEKP